MPPRAVPRTFGDFIFYYYAKLVIAPSAGESGNYRFIMDRYKRLKSGQLQMSDYDREIQHMAQQERLCVFCNRSGKTVPTEVIPRKLGGPIGIHNLVPACPRCAASKGDNELISWWCDRLKRDIEDLHRVPAGLFLKLAYERHVIGFSLHHNCDDIRQLWSIPTPRKGKSSTRRTRA